MSVKTWFLSHWAVDLMCTQHVNVCRGYSWTGVWFKSPLVFVHRTSQFELKCTKSVGQYGSSHAWRATWAVPSIDIDAQSSVREVQLWEKQRVNLCPYVQTVAQNGFIRILCCNDKAELIFNRRNSIKKYCNAKILHWSGSFCIFRQKPVAKTLVDSLYITAVTCFPIAILKTCISCTVFGE